MNVTWNDCKGDVWCHLNSVNLSHEHFDNMEGVYIIWYEETERTVVRVGQGVIKDRIAAHRKDKDVQAYKDLGLYITWASIAENNRDAVEAFLADELNPKVGDRFPDRKPLKVNLPW